MPVFHTFALPLPVVANSGGSVSLAQMITNAFGYTPQMWGDFWVTYYNAADFVAYNLDYWNPAAPVHGAWLVNGGDIGGGFGNQTYVPRSNIGNAVLTTGNTIGPYAFATIGISASPYDVYIQYSMIAVDPDMMRADAATRAPTPQDIVDAAIRLNAEYGYSFNDNDCHYIAAHVGAAAGAVFTDYTQSLNPAENIEYGFWRIAYRGSDPGTVAQWQTLLQPGDIVRMGWTGGGTHTYTVLAVNPNGTVQVYDNTFPGPSGGGNGIHTVNYDDITIPGTVTIYRLTNDGTFLINGDPTFGERLYGSNHFNDRINGLGGNDMLFGGAGNDILDGGAGNDVMDGGAGNDTFYVDSVTDGIYDAPGGGTDQVFASVSSTLITNVENLTLTGASAINGTGNGGDNVITGNGAANTLSGLAGVDTLDGAGGDDILFGGDWTDVLYGRAGNDTLDGGTAGDTMYGGDGDDTYIVDNVADVLIENGPTGGNDLVQSSVSWTLGAGFERLQLTGANAVNGTGNTLANTMNGNSAANVLNAGAGADSVYGEGGDDTLYGGDGDDVVNGGAGADFADGGNNNDQLFGGDDNDTLYGRAGNDELDGGAGADTMYGGAGDDTYFVDNAGDVVGESASAGTDAVYASVNYSLTAYVENLFLVGAATNGAGNILANQLNGNASANVLSGLNGADTLGGYGGDDTLNGGNGNDGLNGGDGADLLDGGNDADTLNGGNDADTLYGRTGNDTLNGDAGADVIYGGDGDDIANGGSENDLIDGGNNNDTLNGGDGDDDLYGRQNNDTLNGGNGADDLYGGDGDDTLSGGDGADMLDGGNGVDRLDGGLGADVLIGGAGADTFVFSTAAGAGNIDTITGFNVADDTIELSVAVFTGIGLGALSANAFVTGAAAVDGDDRIIYNPTTGALFYDADGNGAGAAVQIATLSTGLALTAADIVGGP